MYLRNLRAAEAQSNPSFSPSLSLPKPKWANVGGTLSTSASREVVSSDAQPPTPNSHYITISNTDIDNNNNNNNNDTDNTYSNINYTNADTEADGKEDISNENDTNNNDNDDNNNNETKNNENNNNETNNNDKDQDTYQPTTLDTPSRLQALRHRMSLMLSLPNVTSQKLIRYSKVPSEKKEKPNEKEEDQKMEKVSSNEKDMKKREKHSRLDMSSLKTVTRRLHLSYLSAIALFVCTLFGSYFVSDLFYYAYLFCFFF